MRLLGIKAFLRGGYREQTQPVLVVSHAEPAGIWIPYIDGQLQVRGRGAASELERLIQDRPRSPSRRGKPSTNGQDAGGRAIPEAARPPRGSKGNAT